MQALPQTLSDILAQLNPQSLASLESYAQNLLAQQNQTLQEDNPTYETSTTATEEEENPTEAIQPIYYDAQENYNADDLRAIIAQFPKKRKWVFADLLNEYIFPKEHFVKIEIINFKIYVMPDPSTLHQQVLSDLLTFMNFYVKMNKLGRTLIAPVAVKLDEGNVVKPDLLYISIARLQENPNLIEAQSVNAAPDLVVEVISPANYKKIREAKKLRYAQNGVLEYWEVKPKKKSITVEVLQQGEYVLFSEAKKTGTIHSKVLEGFSLELEQLFEEV